ncbi:MAG: response regulator [Leptolyngbya sp. SIO3F4]|nr:response regulator [Leptolyngbya sp. SIO3F4]
MPVILDLDKRIQQSKERQFTGILSIQAEEKNPWHLYFLAGQIVWANTKTHSKRRWYRQLLRHCPELVQQNNNLEQVLSYQSLAKLVMRKKFGREQFSKLVVGCISEILFDIIQQGTLNFRTWRKLSTYKVIPRDAAQFPCIGLQNVQLWKQVQQDWQTWEQSNLIDILPNQAPVIVDSQKLRERTSLAMFRALTGLVDGQQTLRDLALRVKQPMVPLALSLVPHVRNNLIRMVDIDGLDVDPVVTNQVTSPYQRRSDSTSQNQGTTSVTTSKKSSSTNLSAGEPKVLYIDDSPTDSAAMAQIIQAAGYHYINIADPLQALPQLLEIKPQLIFLDLVMPVANGYELCAQIRRVSAFQETPIVIVTNNDGIADRVRAKVVGASGFMGKPIRQQQVLKVLKKYIQPHRNKVSQVHRQSELSPTV